MTACKDGCQGKQHYLDSGANQYKCGDCHSLVGEPVLLGMPERCLCGALCVGNEPNGASYACGTMVTYTFHPQMQRKTDTHCSLDPGAPIR